MFFCVCTFMLFVTIFCSLSLLWYSQLPSYFSEVVDSSHYSFKHLYLFISFHVTFTPFLNKVNLPNIRIVSAAIFN